MVITPYNRVTITVPKEVITMVKIISLLVSLLKALYSFLYKIELFLLRFLPAPSSSNSIFSEPYRKFTVDDLPVLQDSFLPISLDDAIQLYKDKHNGKEPMPIKRRVPLDIPITSTCPHCGASHDFLFDNRSGVNSKQYRCKICGTTFTLDKPYIQQVTFHCPHCGNKLHPRVNRSNYTVYTCHNTRCSYYTNNKHSMSREQYRQYKINPSSFKLRYITRIFNASISQLESMKAVVTPSKVQLSRIRNSRHILGLILTYHINYGLSLRKTALILREVHDVDVSHQTVANYAQACSHLLDSWLENYQYDGLTQNQCGDETYISVRKKHAYVFFMCDATKKIITAHRAFMKRDTLSAIQTFYSVLRKFKAIPKGLFFTVDGNPIYKAAQQYFHLNHIKFNLFQVIGLSNLNQESKLFRPQKQIIERLNRTFQFSYYVKNGFSSIEKANDFMCLFTTYFNFLRNHSSLGHKPPVLIDACVGVTNMPRKWNILIDLAYDYHFSQGTVSS